jgi:hypothetical protein
MACGGSTRMSIEKALFATIGPLSLGLEVLQLVWVHVSRIVSAKPNTGVINIIAITTIAALTEL